MSLWSCNKNRSQLTEKTEKSFPLMKFKANLSAQEKTKRNEVSLDVKTASQKLIQKPSGDVLSFPSSLLFKQIHPDRMRLCFLIKFDQFSNVYHFQFSSQRKEWLFLFDFLVFCFPTDPRSKGLYGIILSQKIISPTMLPKNITIGRVCVFQISTVPVRGLRRRSRLLLVKDPVNDVEKTA